MRKFDKLISQLKLPIIQAPMAGGITTPQFVAAVANKGIVGSFGFAYSGKDKILSDLCAVKRLSSRGIFNANFFQFTSPAQLDCENISTSLNALEGIDIVENLNITIPQNPFSYDMEDMLIPIWEMKPHLLTFHFGVPSQAIISEAHKKNILVGVSATSLKEAEIIETAGCDFIIAQGIEAGGHRGNFDESVFDEQLPVTELISRCKSRIGLPIVASGGIMTANDVLRFIRMGCSAVQMGTVFLTSTESGASNSYKKALMEKTRAMCFTKGFSGRPAQGLVNKFTQYMIDKPTLPFPYQNVLTAEMRKKATLLNDPEFQSLWAGRSYRECQTLSVATLIDDLSSQYCKHFSGL